jgi:hypothetical protein
MVARGFSGAHISAARTKKQVPNFLREKKNPARARVLGSPTIARAKFLARGIAQISMICYARYLLQTYPSSSVPFFKQMYVLLVTNFCSVSGVPLNFGFLLFFCLGILPIWKKQEKKEETETKKRSGRREGTRREIESKFFDTYVFLAYVLFFKTRY